jgi:hypothetical protein
MTHVIHYHLPEGKKPSPLIEAFMEAADAAGELREAIEQKEDDELEEDEEREEDEDGYPIQDEREYDEFDFEPDYDAEVAAGEGALIDRIMNGGDHY